MAKESEAKEWVGHPFGEENPADAGRNICKCITDTADDQVLEKSGIPCKWRLLALVRVTALTYQLKWQPEDWEQRQRDSFPLL